MVVDDGLQLTRQDLHFLNTELKGLAFEADHLSHRPKNLIHCLTDKPLEELYFMQGSRDGAESKTFVKEYFDKTYGNYFVEKFKRKVNGKLPAVQVSVFSSNFALPIHIAKLSEGQTLIRFNFVFLAGRQRQKAVLLPFGGGPNGR